LNNSQANQTFETKHWLDDLVKRNVHQEVAFEHYIRDKDVSYVAIDEAKRPLAIDKNFDFLVFTKTKVLVVDVKGKQIPYIGKGGFPWETWIHSKDLTGLRQWEDMFKSLLNCPVESLLVFVYLINDKSYIKDFQTIYKYHGNTYGIVGITITEFEKNKKVRSGFSTEKQVWQLPREKAKGLLQDVNSFLK
jgi:hypothetical protein